MKLSNDCAKLLIAELGSKGVGPLSESGVTAAHVAASSGEYILYVYDTETAYHNLCMWQLQCLFYFT